MTDRLLRDAARLLSRMADELRYANTLPHKGRNAWEPSEIGDAAKADHDEMREVAKQLRARAKETV